MRSVWFHTLLCWLCLWGLHSEARDFKTIKEQGTLKALYWSGYEGYLPRAGFPLEQEKAAIGKFAQQHGLQVQFVAVAGFDELIPALNNGRGDVIATNMTVTSGRSRAVSFTHAVATTYEYLVRAANTPLKDTAALNRMSLAVREGTAFTNTAKGLKKVYPGLTINYLDSNLSTDAVLDKLVAGEIQLTLLDGNTLSAVAQYRDDIKRSFQASGKRSIAWAVEKNNHSLLSVLNAFLEQERLAVNIKPKKTAKNRWQQIKQDKIIRFAMRNNMASYFIWHGELHGFNYEMARHFADQHDLRYQILVAPDNEALLKYVIEGKADVALGFLTPTDERKAMGIAFSRPYHYASEVVVARADDNSIKEIDDLNNRKIYTRPSSAYWTTVTALKAKIPDLELLPVAETVETEELIAGVADDTYDLTVADNHILDLELTWRDDVQSVMALGKPKAQSWAVNGENRQLLKVVNAYIRKQYRGLYYNITYKKYFKNQHRILKAREGYEAVKQKGRLSPYDNLVKEQAQQYGFDWRLLVSQMFQESRFDPKASSWAGASGLFQVMPKTAKELGIDNLEKPKNGIRAGVAYMNWVRDRARYMKPKDEENLVWFTLASYNAGAGHVKDAIRLARRKGWRSDVWFGHVERAMLLLSKPEYAAKARYGYVRGHEPVEYLRQIRKRYRAYREVADL